MSGVERATDVLTNALLPEVPCANHGPDYGGCVDCTGDAERLSDVGIEALAAENLLAQPTADEAEGDEREALATIREICAQVEANPVGWGGASVVSLARTIARLIQDGGAR